MNGNICNYGKISERTGRKLEGLEEHLSEMRERGQIFGIDLGEVKMFKMVPWAFGIYEFQRPHMDRELAEMCEEFMKDYGEQFFDKKPLLMQLVTAVCNKILSSTWCRIFC